MSIRIIEETTADLHEYGTVSAAFTVNSRFLIEPIDRGLGGLALQAKPVQPPYVKDYDRDNEYGPQGWADRWSIAHWGVLAAFDGPKRAGGAVIAWNSSEIHMLEGRQDLAVLWDIRVDPDYRNQGIGSALFSAAADWAKGRGCVEMKVETQDVNVPACHFYAGQGCQLAAIDPFAYRDQPDEVQFIWLLRL